MKENPGGSRRTGGAPAAANAASEDKMMARLDAIGSAMHSVQDTVKGIKESQKEPRKEGRAASHSFRRGADKQARIFAEKKEGIPLERVNTMFGWDQRAMEKDIQLRYDENDLDKRIRGCRGQTSPACTYPAHGELGTSSRMRRVEAARDHRVGWLRGSWQRAAKAWAFRTLGCGRWWR
jgi:hypothetical protein